MLSSILEKQLQPKQRITSGDLNTLQREATLIDANKLATVRRDIEKKPTVI